MYTGHFGLDDGPFHGKAEGGDVYIGAQQAAVVARLRKVLGMSDTAVTVSGPVGVGKTTLVRRALTELAGRKTIIPVDRMRLEADEVLELLLSRFDVSRQPKGTIQRVSAFRRLLHDRLASDTRVFIVVEDAERIGVDALLELEALTATDSGEPVGANIVLMGAGELSGLLAQPALARLRQRIRLRQAVAPFDEAEVEGYMRHCLESAGGVLEQIFEPGTVRIVYRYSGGVARVVDNLCEAALVAAAEAGLATILPEFLQEVAENCGLEAPAEPECGPEEPASARPGEIAGNAESELSLPRPAQPPAPPKLALVELSPPAEDAVTPEEAPEALPDSVLAEHTNDAESPVDGEPLLAGGSELAPPIVDVADHDHGEATGIVQHVDECESREPGVTESSIDEVLPGLVERLQSHAEGRVAEPEPAPDCSCEDWVEIPTLSNSMRVAVLPIRPMKERPRTAGDADDNARPEETQATVSVVPCPLPEETNEADESQDDDTGIAPALAGISSEADPVVTALESVDAVAEAAVEAADPVQEASAVDALPADSAVPPAPTAAEEAEAAPEPKEVAEEASKGAVQTRNAATDPDQVLAGTHMASPAGAGANDAAANDALAADEEPAELELSLAAEHEWTPDVAVDVEKSDDEVTTEAVTLSFDEELSLAGDAPAEQRVAENKERVADAGEPELDALEAAIQAANAWQASEAGGDAEPVAREPSQAKDPGLPEITLDDELGKARPASSDLDRWADELSKAKSLEDISDILAETIFGNEAIEAISAEIRANRAAERPSSTEIAAAPAAARPPAREAQPATPKAPAARPGASARPSPGPAAPAVAKTPAKPATANGINMTMSQRIEMVKSLKGTKPIKPKPGMKVAEIVLAEQPDAPVAPAANGPQPIEAQIDTAITQSRKVLSEADLARLAASEDDDDDNKGKRGLFGFFRRSSKS